MANIFIQGLNSISGGGKSILDNYLSLLKCSKSSDVYYILTPCKKEYEKFATKNIIIIDIQDKYKKLYMVYIRYEFILPKLIDELKIDTIFNLSDVPIKAGGVKQIFLFDWAYAIYPESIVWKKMDVVSFIERKIKVYFFKKYSKYITTTIAQTEAVKSRLIRLYKSKNVVVIPNAVSIENMQGGEYRDFSLPEGKNLLYLSVYFPHKNLEIFLPLAKKIKEQGLDYKIIITIEESQHRKVRDFLNVINKEKLDDIIINIGPVKMQHVPSLYKQCDALLMPTLLESFGLTYIEAMSNQLSIFTSDLDFAHDVCGDSAYYFDPLCSQSILETMNEAFDNENVRVSKIKIGSHILKSFLTWNEVLNKYSKLMVETK